MRAPLRSPARRAVTRLAAGLALALPFAAVTGARAQLAIHPDNPHYFVDTATVKPVLIFGYNSIVPFASPDPVSGELGLDDLAGHRVMWGRVWHLGDPWPWSRGNVPGGPGGGNKYDLTVFNETYFSAVRNAVGLARDRAMWAEIHFFDKSSMNGEWADYPIAKGNCVNDIDSPANDQSALATRPKMVAFQDAYVKKMIDETIDFENMVYEIENEHDGDHPVYAQHFADLVKSHLASNHPGQHRLVSYSTMSFFNKFLVPRWSWGKPINIDEFANGLADKSIARAQAWTIISSGGHLHFEDTDYAVPFDILANIRTFLERSGWDFVHSAPDSSRVPGGGGYCMAAPAAELMCYFRAGPSASPSRQAATRRASGTREQAASRARSRSRTEAARTRLRPRRARTGSCTCERLPARARP